MRRPKTRNKASGQRLKFCGFRLYLENVSNIPWQMTWAVSRFVKNYSWKNVGSYVVTNCLNLFGGSRLEGSENKNASWNVFVRVNCLFCNYPMIISEDLFSSTYHTHATLGNFEFTFLLNRIFPWIECWCRRLLSFGKKLKFLVFNLCKDKVISSEQPRR